LGERRAYGMYVLGEGTRVHTHLCACVLVTETVAIAAGSCLVHHLAGRAPGVTLQQPYNKVPKPQDSHNMSACLSPPVLGSTMRATFLPPAAAEAAITAAMWRSKYCWSVLLGGSPSCCSAAPAGHNSNGKGSSCKLYDDGFHRSLTINL
jgi:hypothetical protein